MSMLIHVLYFHYLVVYASTNKQEKFSDLKTLNMGSVFINEYGNYYYLYLESKVHITKGCGW